MNEDHAVRMIGFMVDERPHVFVHDNEANRQFLEISRRPLLGVPGSGTRAWIGIRTSRGAQHAAAALRVVYSQAVETLFGLLAAFVQCPHYPLAWLMRYSNRDLRSVVAKIDRGTALSCALKAPLSWEAISGAVHQFVPSPAREHLTQDFARLWQRLARKFLGDDQVRVIELVVATERPLVSRRSIAMR